MTERRRVAAPVDAGQSADDQLDCEPFSGELTWDLSRKSLENEYRQLLSAFAEASMQVSSVFDSILALRPTFFDGEDVEGQVLLLLATALQKSVEAAEQVLRQLNGTTRPSS